MIPRPPISVADKAFPPHLWGVSPTDLEVPLSAFATPVVTLDDAAIDHNTAVMAAWARHHGLALAPHGKTTMAPALWRRLLDAGAWGITLATGWQAQVAHAHGIPRVQLAAPLLDAGAWRWLRDARAGGFELVCWADSSEAVARMSAQATSAASPPVPVLVELGGQGGRTGARSIAAAREVAEAIAAAPGLTLAGVAGYEGALAHDRSSVSLAAVDAYLGRLAELSDAVRPLVGWGAPPLLSAGGSAYPDRIAAVLSGRSETVVLRAGAYQIHDDGFYAGISPLRADLRSAMHAWARVLSTPEPGLALLDAGRRDVSFDEGLPRLQAVHPEGAPRRDADAPVRALNDQHAFQAQPVDGPPLVVGDVVRLGLSHPCTVLDKWRRLPLVADARASDPVVIGAVETWF